MLDEFWHFYGVFDKWAKESESGGKPNKSEGWREKQRKWNEQHKKNRGK